MAATAIDRLEKKTARETVERAHETFGLPYTELADALGVDRRTLLRYRKESHAPSPRVRAQQEKVREIRHPPFGDGGASIRSAGASWTTSFTSLLDMDDMIGALIRRAGEEDCRVFVAEDVDGEKEMFREFVQWFSGYEWQHPGRSHPSGRS